MLIKFQTPSTRQWRTLIRVTSYDGAVATIVIPAWDSRKTLIISKELPSYVKDFLDEQKDFPVRIYAEVNIGIDFVKELKFDNWEI